MSLATEPPSSLSSFSPLNRTLTKLSTLKPTSIICKYTQFYEPEPDGAGPAALTRGDIFLERHSSLEASAAVLPENKETKKKEKENVFKVSSYLIHSCYGCGAPLQTSETDAPGYADLETYNLVDIMDFNGSVLARVLDLAGANPIILVVTKVPKLQALTWHFSFAGKGSLHSGLSQCWKICIHQCCIEPSCCGSKKIRAYSICCSWNYLGSNLD